MINRKTVKVGGAQVTVRTSTGWANADADTLRRKLILSLGKEVEEEGKTVFRVDDQQWGRLSQFVLMLINTEKVDGDLGFPWPLPFAPEQDLVKAFHQIGECLNANDVQAWYDALQEVDRPAGDPDLWPSADPNSSGQKPKPSEKL